MDENVYLACTQLPAVLPGSCASWGCEVVTVNELTSGGVLGFRNVHEVFFIQGLKQKMFTSKKKSFSHMRTAVPGSRLAVCAV